MTMKINWIPELLPDEWPNGVLEQMDPALFNNAVIPLRQMSGIAMTPSPLPEAHVRHEGESRHSTKRGTRLSDATDLFINGSQAADMWRLAQRIPDIGGFGMYFDTNPSIMIHIDTRPDRLLWIRVGGAYIYEHRDPAFFYTQLGRQLEKLR